MNSLRPNALLCRLYINWAITLLILLIPRYFKTARAYSAKADSLMATAMSKAEAAVVHATSASNLADEAWCNAIASAIEKSNLIPPVAGSSSDYRSAQWRDHEIRSARERAGALFAEASDLSKRADRLTRSGLWLAGLTIAPVWAAGAALPWLLHFSIAWLVSKQHN